MGCDVVVGGASPAEARGIERLFTERDRTFSRFRADSELSRVNRSSSAVVSVSAAFAEMVGIALQAAASTGGLVDPTLGEAIEAAGYDRDFGRLGPSPRPPRPASPGRLHAVRASERALSRPTGMLLDLNGVVKGKTVDDALELISRDGFVCAGGDLVTRGALDVALPGGDAVRLVAGGPATSGSAKRRWLRSGSWQHHLIDPGTGASARSPWVEVTACAATCLQADVAAKAALLLGHAGPAFLDERGLAGRFLGHFGEIVCTRRWPLSDRVAA
jgi:FAD:protein FMN transferase